MAVTYKTIDNERVSKEWYTVLMDMRRAGVRFNVNEGHRTMARQAYFWSGSPNNPNRTWRGNLAARPSPYAPHIREGRIDHAIDFSNDAAVFRWLSRNGLNPRRTVRGESWHIEVSAPNLRSYHRKHGNDLPVLRRGQKGRSIIKLKKRLYDKGLRNFSGVRSSNRYNPFFSQYTEMAVKRFQRRHGLTADGVVGPRTWELLAK